MIYQQKLKAAKLQIRIVKRWDQDSIQQFQGCFHCTDGASFVGACVDLHEYTDVVTSYVHCCEESQPRSNQIKSWANDKPWFKSVLGAKLKVKEASPKSGDRVLSKKAKI